MGKYLITGNAGSGKSTVIATLADLGYAAYDADELPDVTRKIPSTHPATLAFSLAWEKSALETLLRTEKDIFLGGSVSNQSKFYPLFDKIFLLKLDTAALEQRLATRTNNEFGNNPEERQLMLNIHLRVQTNLLKAGAIEINASQPVNEVVAAILKVCHDNR